MAETYVPTNKAHIRANEIITEIGKLNDHFEILGLLTQRKEIVLGSFGDRSGLIYQVIIPQNQNFDVYITLEKKRIKDEISVLESEYKTLFSCAEVSENTKQ